MYIVCMHDTFDNLRIHFFSSIINPLPPEAKHDTYFTMAIAVTGTERVNMMKQIGCEVIFIEEKQNWNILVQGNFLSG